MESENQFKAINQQEPKWVGTSVQREELLKENFTNILYKTLYSQLMLNTSKNVRSR